MLRQAKNAEHNREPEWANGLLRPLSKYFILADDLHTNLGVRNPSLR
jgi:hypothetical protein